LGAGLYGGMARRTVSSELAALALSCAAYASILATWRVLPRPFLAMDCVAPFALTAAFLALWLSRAANQTPEEARPSETAALWREPLTAMALLAVIFACADGLRALLMARPVPHLALSLLPGLLTALLLTASRREPGRDLSRALALGLLHALAALEVAVLCGLA